MSSTPKTDAAFRDASCNVAESFVEFARSQERQVADLHHILGEAGRAQLFEDGVAGDLHSLGITRPSAAYLQGRIDVLGEIAVAVAKAESPKGNGQP